MIINVNQEIGNVHTRARTHMLSCFFPRDAADGL